MAAGTRQATGRRPTIDMVPVWSVRRAHLRGVLTGIVLTWGLIWAMRVLQ